MDDYYVNQAGSGLGGFQGTRYQKGDGFFGRLISGTFLPIIKKVLPYLGKTALNTGMDIVGDIAQGEKFKDSFKNRMRETGDKLTTKAAAKAKELTGTGRQYKNQGKPRNTSRNSIAIKRKEKKIKSKNNIAFDFL